MTTELIIDLEQHISENHPELPQEKLKQIAEFVIPRVDRTHILDEIDRWVDMYLLSETPPS